MQSGKSLSEISLVHPMGASAIAESYISLWQYGSSYIYTNNTSTTVQFLMKGTSATDTAGTSVSDHLYTVPSTWSPQQQFAIEVCFYTASGGTAYAQAYDLTTKTAISSSLISTTSTTPVIIRSSSFNLIGGDALGIAIYNNNTAYNTYLVRAYLIALF